METSKPESIPALGLAQELKLARELESIPGLKLDLQLELKPE